MPLFIGFIPTPEEEVNSFFDLAPVSSADVVYDLGSGDGRLLFAALEKGAGKAVGIELNPWQLAKAREKAASQGLAGQDNVPGIRYIRGQSVRGHFNPLLSVHYSFQGAEIQV
jgi:cyclopropane fatty-acyl-phospholipid synthase-like methyltransferase